MALYVTYNIHTRRRRAASAAAADLDREQEIPHLDRSVGGRARDDYLTKQSGVFFFFFFSYFQCYVLRLNSCSPSLNEGSHTYSDNG